MEHKKTMLDYIADCPEFIRNNVADSVALTKPLVDEYVSGGYKNIWIVACGSSSNGSLCARQFIRRHLKCEVKIVTPFHFVSSENDFGETDMVVVVSQSGYSLNALDAIKVIEAKGRRCIGLTGDVNSDLGKVCDVVANYGVGRETVAYVTRGVTTLALFFMLFAVEAAVRLGIKTAAEGEAVKQQLLKAADINAAVQAQTPSFIKEHYRQLSGMTNAYVCGVGANLGTASEGALKFGETVSIPTAVYEVEEYIHGPNIQMTPRYSVFLIDGGEGTERIHRIFEGTQIVTDNAFLLTRCADYKDEHNVMYADIVGHETYAGTVQCAAQNDLIPAAWVADGRLYPQRTVTAADFLAVLMPGAAGRRPLAAPSPLPDSVPAYARFAAGQAVAEQLISADSLNDPITRSDAAALCRRLHI